jgi:hypothetical protein
MAQSHPCAASPLGAGAGNRFTGLHRRSDSSIVSVDYAMNGDALFLLLFARTLEPVTIPMLSWRGLPQC